MSFTDSQDFVALEPDSQDPLWEEVSSPKTVNIHTIRKHPSQVSLFSSLPSVTVNQGSNASVNIKDMVDLDSSRESGEIVDEPLTVNVWHITQDKWDDDFNYRKLKWRYMVPQSQIISEIIRNPPVPKLEFTPTAKLKQLPTVITD